MRENKKAEYYYSCLKTSEILQWGPSDAAQIK